MAFIPYKYGNLAMGIQREQGTEATIFYLIPLPDGADAMNNRKNYSFFQYSGTQWQRAHYETEGEYTEGTFKMPLVPGFVGVGFLYDWIWGRTGTYNQSAYLTIYRDLGNRVEKYLDVKCTGGTIAVDYGALYASAELNLTGIKAAEEDSFPGAPLDDMLLLRPYRYSETSIALALGNSAVTRNHNIKWDNKNVAPADMGVLNGDTFPYALPEEAKAEWGGSFDKYFVDDELYSAFLLGNEASLLVTLARAAVATATFTFPRILYTEDPLKLPGSGLIKEEGIAWEALGSMDGATEACDIDEGA